MCRLLCGVQMQNHRGKFIVPCPERFRKVSICFPSILSLISVSIEWLNRMRYSCPLKLFGLRWINSQLWSHCADAEASFAVNLFLDGFSIDKPTEVLIIYWGGILVTLPFQGRQFLFYTLCIMLIEHLMYCCLLHHILQKGRLPPLATEVMELQLLPYDRNAGDFLRVSCVEPTSYPLWFLTCNCLWLRLKLMYGQSSVQPYFFWWDSGILGFVGWGRQLMAVGFLMTFWKTSPASTSTVVLFVRFLLSSAFQVALLCFVCM